MKDFIKDLFTLLITLMLVATTGIQSNAQSRSQVSFKAGLSNLFPSPARSTYNRQ